MKAINSVLPYRGKRPERLVKLNKGWGSPTMGMVGWLIEPAGVTRPVPYCPVLGMWHVMRVKRVWRVTVRLWAD